MAHGIGRGGRHAVLDLGFGGVVEVEPLQTQPFLRGPAPLGLASGVRCALIGRGRSGLAHGCGLCGFGLCGCSPCRCRLARNLGRTLHAGILCATGGRTGDVGGAEIAGDGFGDRTGGTAGCLEPGARTAAVLDAGLDQAIVVLAQLAPGGTPPPFHVGALLGGLPGGGGLQQDVDAGLEGEGFVREAVGHAGRGALRRDEPLQGTVATRDEGAVTGRRIGPRRGQQLETGGTGHLTAAGGMQRRGQHEQHGQQGGRGQT